MRKIIAIRDNLAGDVVGPLWLFRADAPAIRQFADIANMKESQVHQHLEDHDLIQIGILQDDLTITPIERLLITGKAYAETLRAQQQQAE